MSGTQSLVPTGVGNGGIPHQSRVWGFSQVLTAGVTLTFDLRPLRNRNIIKDVQGIFIDNSANNAQASVGASGGQLIVVPPNSQGYFPLYLSDNDVLTFTGNGTVNYTLLNFPTPAYTWSAISPAGVTLTSRSVVSPGAAASFPIAAANASRKYLVIAAPQAAILWLNLLGGVASAGGADCFPVAAGGVYESGSYVTKAAVNGFTTAVTTEIAAAEG